MRREPLRLLEPVRLAPLVEPRADFRKVHVQTPFLHAATPEPPRDPVQERERGWNPVSALASETGRLRIGERGVAPDDAAHQAALPHGSLLVQIDHQAQGEPVLPLDEAAQPSGERLGKHGIGRVGEVGAVPPRLSFQVQRSARRDVVAHVGDVDSDLVGAVRGAPHGERVVVVLGVLGVDGEDDVVPEIRSPVRRARHRGFVVRGRLGQRLGIEFGPDSLLQRDHPAVLARIVRAEHGDDLPL